jgi:hypothetical protein
MTELPHGLLAIVERIEQKTYILKLEDGQQLAWPKSKLESVSIGDSIQLLALTRESIEQERSKLAKHILNHMLSGESP